MAFRPPPPLEGRELWGCRKSPIGGFLPGFLQPGADIDIGQGGEGMEEGSMGKKYGIQERRGLERRSTRGEGQLKHCGPYSHSNL